MLAVRAPPQQIPRYYTEPDYNDVYRKEQKRRGIGDLMRFSSRHNTSSSSLRYHEPTSSQLLLATESRDRQPQANVLCPRTVHGQSYWSVTADPDYLGRLKTQVDNLLYNHDHELHRHDRRSLAVYAEPFMVGKTKDVARMTVVISCLRSEDEDRVRKLIRKYSHVPEYEDVELKVMLGSPRSQKELKKLASVLSDDRSTVDDLPRRHRRAPLPPNELLIGTLVYSTVGPSGALQIPGTIWIGEKETGSHQATLGGLVSVARSDQKLGFTVAHKPSGEDKTQSVEIAGSVTRKVIGYVVDDSKEDGSDWALIKFDTGIHARTSILPPDSLGVIPDEPTTIQVLTTRGSLSGTLSGSVTWIHLSGSASSTKAWPISVNGDIRRGDCGSWVVGPNNELFGYIVFGHDGESFAYILSAEDAFNEIDYIHKIRLSDISPKQRRKTLKAERRALLQDLETPTGVSKAPRRRTKAPHPAIAVNSSTSSESEDSVLEHRSKVRRKNDRTKAERRRQRSKSPSSRHSPDTSSSSDSNHEVLVKRSRVRIPDKLKDSWSRNLRCMVICMAYLIYFGIVAIQYYLVATWALCSSSKLAAQSRRTLATLMVQTINQLQSQITKEPEKLGLATTHRIEDNKPVGRAESSDLAENRKVRRKKRLQKSGLDRTHNLKGEIKIEHNPSLFGRFAYSDDGDSSIDGDSSDIRRPQYFYSTKDGGRPVPREPYKTTFQRRHRYPERSYDDYDVKFDEFGLGIRDDIRQHDRELNDQILRKLTQISDKLDALEVTDYSRRRDAAYDSVPRRQITYHHEPPRYPDPPRAERVGGAGAGIYWPGRGYEDESPRRNRLLGNERRLVQRRSSFDRTRPNSVITTDRQNVAYERKQGPSVVVHHRPIDDVRLRPTSTFEGEMQEELKNKIEREIDLGVERGMETELQRIRQRNRKRESILDEDAGIGSSSRSRGPRERSDHLQKRNVHYLDDWEFDSPYEVEREILGHRTREREARIRAEAREEAFREQKVQELRRAEERLKEEKLRAEVRAEARAEFEEKREKEAYEREKLERVREEMRREERTRLVRGAGGMEEELERGNQEFLAARDRQWKDGERVVVRRWRSYEEEEDEEEEEDNAAERSTLPPRDYRPEAHKGWRNHGWRSENDDTIRVIPKTTYEERYEGALVKYEGPREIPRNLPPVASRAEVIGGYEYEPYSDDIVEVIEEHDPPYRESIDGGIIRRATAVDTSDEEFEPSAPAKTRALNSDEREIMKEISADEMSLYD